MSVRLRSLDRINQCRELAPLPNVNALSALPISPPLLPPFPPPPLPHLIDEGCIVQLAAQINQQKKRERGQKSPSSVVVSNYSDQDQLLPIADRHRVTGRRSPFVDSSSSRTHLYIYKRLPCPEIPNRARYPAGICTVAELRIFLTETMTILWRVSSRDLWTQAEYERISNDSKKNFDLNQRMFKNLDFETQRFLKFPMKIHPRMTTKNQPSKNPSSFDQTIEESCKNRHDESKS